MGMDSVRCDGDLRPQYVKTIPILVFLGWSSLPGFWQTFVSFLCVLWRLLLPGGDSAAARFFWVLAFCSRNSGALIFDCYKQLTIMGLAAVFQQRLLRG